MDCIFPAEPIFYVQSEFDSRRIKNSSYSVRAFARDLGISPSHLSEFLSGKSRLSYEKAPHLAEKLKLEGEHKDHWCDLLAVHSRLKRDREAAKFRILNRLGSAKGAVSGKVYKTISDWYHFAILTYFGANSTLTSAELSRRLNISERKVKTAIKTMLQLNLIEQVESGCVPTDDFTFAGNTIPSEAIRESHRQILKKATKALDGFDIKQRESQSLFVSVPQEKYAAFKEAARKQLLQLAAEYSEINLSKDQLQVQALTLQIFPLEESNDL